MSLVALLKEWLWVWANRSCHSLKKNNHDCSLLKSNMNDLLFFTSESHFRSQKRKIHPKIFLIFFKVFGRFSQRFPFFMPKGKSLLSLFTKEWLSFLKERCEPFDLFHEQITLLLFCSQKTNNLLKKSMSEFPTLVFEPKSKKNLAYP